MGIMCPIFIFRRFCNCSPTLFFIDHSKIPSIPFEMEFDTDIHNLKVSFTIDMNESFLLVRTLLFWQS